MTVKAQRAYAGIEGFSVREEEASPTIRLRRHGRGAWVRVGACAAVLLAGLVTAAHLWSEAASARDTGDASTPHAVARRADPVKPAWIDVVRPLPLFDIAGSEFGKLPLDYRARRLGDGTAREDVLTYGRFGEAGAFLTLSVLRAPVASAPPAFFVDMARVAAGAGLAVIRSGQPSALPSRFGAFSTADVMLDRNGVGSSCLGFRLEPDASTAPVGMAGLACGTAARPADRKTLACVLDRVDLLSAGDDAGLRDFFVAAEARRASQCSGKPMLAAGASVSAPDGVLCGDVCGHALLPPPPIAPADRRIAASR